MLDDNAPIGGVLNPATPRVPVALVPQDIPATAVLKRTTVAAGVASTLSLDTASLLSANPNLTRPVFNADQNFGIPLDAETRAKALKEVDNQLIAKNLIDKEGKVSKETKQVIEFEMEFSLPTPGIIVKGCLDDCDVCEPALKERMQLENDLLRKQIELLEKSQEYRCCPPAPVITE